jgi:hypothetical protein
VPTLQDESASHVDDDRLGRGQQFAAGNGAAPCGASPLKSVVTANVSPKDTRPFHSFLFNSA